jgi:hypothetical protein
MIGNTESSTGLLGSIRNKEFFLLPVRLSISQEICPSLESGRYIKLHVTVGFEVLKAVFIESPISSEVTPRNPLKVS